MFTAFETSYMLQILIPGSNNTVVITYSTHRSGTPVKRSRKLSMPSLVVLYCPHLIRAVQSVLRVETDFFKLRSQFRHSRSGNSEAKLIVSQIRIDAISNSSKAGGQYVIWISGLL